MIAIERLIDLADHTGDFFAPYPPDQRTREALLQHTDASGGAELRPHVLSAARLLRAPAAQRGAYAGPQQAGSR